jgi:hypothetical protein
MITGLLILSSSNTAQRINSTIRTPFTAVSFWGYSGFLNNVPLSNTGSVYVGSQSGILPIEVTAGGTAGITLTDKTRDNLYNYWVGGSTSDGLYYMAW